MYVQEVFILHILLRILNFGMANSEVFEKPIINFGKTKLNFKTYASLNYDDYFGSKVGTYQEKNSK